MGGNQEREEGGTTHRQRQGKSGRVRSIKRQRDINKKAEQQRPGVSKSEINKEGETTLRECTNRNTEAENESWAKKAGEKKDRRGERGWARQTDQLEGTQAE